MAKTLIYTGVLGPEKVAFGVAGQFIKGEPKLIEDDEIAKKLLAKGYFEEQVPVKAGKAAAPTTTE